MASLYSVTYNTNNSTGGTTPPTQTAESNSETYTFVVPTADQYGLVRVNYGFVGWSEDPNTTIAQYAPGSTIELNSTNPSKILYAVWQPGLMLITNMQEMTTNVCQIGTNIGETKQLIDTRKNTDGNTRTYWVAKLADGNCWMTQNLDYDDLSGIRRTGDTRPDSWPNNDIRQYWDPGEKVVSEYSLAVADNNTNRHLLVGNYYSWLSATNGTGDSTTTDGTDASESICPDGWQLPLSGSKNGLSASAASGSFGLMLSKQNVTNNAAGSTVIRSTPLYYVYSGNVNSDSLNNAGTNGHYWAATANSPTNAYLLRFTDNAINPFHSDFRYYGFSVRCVAR